MNDYHTDPTFPKESGLFSPQFSPCHGPLDVFRPLTKYHDEIVRKMSTVSVADQIVMISARGESISKWKLFCAIFI